MDNLEKLTTSGTQD